MIIDSVSHVFDIYKFADQNSDGFLTRKEWRKAYEKSGQKWENVDEEWFQTMDANKDGKVSFKGDNKYE